MAEKGWTFSFIKVAPKLILVILLFFVLWVPNPNFEILLGIQALSYFITCLCALWMTRAYWLPSIYVRIDVWLMKRLLHFSAPLIIGSLSMWGATSLDRILLGVYSNFTELAIYSVTASFAAVIGLVSTVFSNLWHPTLYKWLSDGIDKRRLETVLEACTLTLAILWGFAGLICQVIPYLLPDAYLQVEYLVTGLIAYSISYILSEVTVAGISITRKTSYAMLCSLLAFFLNFALNIVLIPTYGASGAVLATMCSGFVYFSHAN